MDDIPLIDPEEVTVAWICALPVELMVAQAALDEEYRLKHTTDFLPSSSSYAVGRVGSHKVVVACLENSRNTGAATRTAERLKHAFKYIELGIMVGIGGGVPYWGDDIRLGDIVVSQPQHASSGVIAWDGGKLLGDGFDYRGHYAAPADRLLSAAIALDARKRLRRRNLRTELVAVMERINEELIPPIERPGEAANQPEQPSHRESTRSPSDTAPQVHRGVIASGRSVIASAQKRDIHAQQIFDKTSLKILCFEMEASDVVNSIPCLIVRGISDFSDEQKNDDWHGYAALAAAAYAKTLINSIETVAHRFTEDKVEKNEILNSLKFPEMWTRQVQLGNAQAGTFRWILEEEDHAVNPYKKQWDSFREWLKGDQKVYWIHGKPGSGKSTLVQFLCDHESDLRQALVEWSGGDDVLMPRFFHWRLGTLQQHSLSGMLRSLLFQVLSSDGGAFSRVASNRQPTGHSAWTLDRLKTTFWEAIRASKLHICFFIDGLDEFCGFNNAQSRRPFTESEETIGDMLDCLKELMAMDRVKVCISSRPEPALNSAFKHYPQLKLEDLTSHDIKIYLREKFKHIPSSADLQGRVEYQAQGVFLWVKLVVECLLGGYRNQDSQRDLEKRLYAIPSRLEDLYAHILDNLDPITKSECIFGMSLVTGWRKYGDLDAWLGDLMIDALIMMRRFGRHADLVSRLDKGETVDLDSALAEACSKTIKRLENLSCGIIETHPTKYNHYLCPLSPRTFLDGGKGPLFEDDGRSPLKQAMDYRHSHHKWPQNIIVERRQSNDLPQRPLASSLLNRSIHFIHRTAGEFVAKRYGDEIEESFSSREAALLILRCRQDIATLFAQLYRRNGIEKTVVDICDVVWLKPFESLQDDEKNERNFPDDPLSLAVWDTGIATEQTHQSDREQGFASIDAMALFYDFQRVSVDNLAQRQSFDDLWDEDPRARQRRGFLTMCAAWGFHEYCEQRADHNDNTAATMMCAAATLSLEFNLQERRTERHAEFMKGYNQFIKTLIMRGADISMRTWTFDLDDISQPGPNVWGHLIKAALRCCSGALSDYDGRLPAQVLAEFCSAIRAMYPGHVRDSTSLVCTPFDASPDTLARLGHFETRLPIYVILEMNAASILGALMAVGDPEFSAFVRQRLYRILPIASCIPRGLSPSNLESGLIPARLTSRSDELWVAAALGGDQFGDLIPCGKYVAELKTNAVMASRLQHYIDKAYRDDGGTKHDGRLTYAWHDPRNVDGPYWNGRAPPKHDRKLPGEVGPNDGSDEGYYDLSADEDNKNFDDEDRNGSEKASESV